MRTRSEFEDECFHQAILFYSALMSLFAAVADKCLKEPGIWATAVQDNVRFC